ncbi:MAG TPA: DUF2442 domain-containing protein [Pyrinomonadaceae bacterium]|nr:DUF2442 domain-containing protein [Pyrinomonadaceae bacterium]
MIKVTAVKANDDYTLDLRFSDGSVKRFDVKPYLKYEVFRELKDLSYFKQVTLAFGAVQWPHEQDIAPDTLFLEGSTAPVENSFVGNNEG